VVLEAGNDDLVAFLQESLSEAGGHQVDRLGSVAREDDFVFVPGVEECLHLAPRLIVTLGRPLAQEVKPTMNIGVIPGIKRPFGLDHLGRFLRRGGGVQIDQRAAAHRPVQDREIRAYGFDVVRNRVPQIAECDAHGPTPSRRAPSGARTLAPAA
jgi:hypothetical protein